MNAETLTTKEVARLCRVSDATVKRWEESGLLQSERTRGGHRRFRIEEIARFRRASGLGSKHCHGDESVMTTASRRRLNKSHSTCNFFHSIVAGCEQESANILVNKYLHGTELTTIFDGLISSALGRVGELWCHGELNVAQKHLAVRTTLAALQKLREVIPVFESHHKPVICCTIDGDFHELPAYAAQLTFENQGFDVINFGANTPFCSLIEEVIYYSPAFICIAATAIVDFERIAADYKEFRRKTVKLGIPVILGGKAFERKNTVKRFPAEIHAKTFTQLEEYLKSRESGVESRETKVKESQISTLHS